MTKGQLQIHSQNILPIIKKWLYSEHDIFLREFDICIKLKEVPGITGRKNNENINLSDSGGGNGQKNVCN